MNYYNEFDAKAAAWLRALIAAGLIPPGDVDTRSITEIKPHELTRYTQCHFFAGIGGWSLALELAGWPATRPVWTGSCPCQPFSSAGKQLAQADARHLWPVFFNLIRECRPLHVFGEQVASAIGKGWLDGVSADLEGAGYACGAAVLGAHSVGAPHIRQRLYWVADAGHRNHGSEGRTESTGRGEPCGTCDGLADAADLRRDKRRGSAPSPLQGSGTERSAEHTRPEHDGELSRRPEGLGSGPGSGGMADTASSVSDSGKLGLNSIGGRDHGIAHGEERADVGLADTPSGGQRIDGSAPRQAGHADERGKGGGLGDAFQSRLEGQPRHGDDGRKPGRLHTDAVGSTPETSGLVPAHTGQSPGFTSGLPDASGDMGGCGQHEPERGAQGRASNRGPDAWSCFDLIPCADGKARRIEPGLAPLAHGIPARVVRLRGYGNAIVPHVAAEFITAFLES